MKNRMLVLFGGLAAAAVIGITCYTVYAKQNTFYINMGDPEQTENGQDAPEFTEMPVFMANRLIGEAESKEEAEEIAGLYGITLVEYQEGRALYETEEDPLTVIARGEKEGYPQLWTDNIRTMD